MKTCLKYFILLLCLKFIEGAFRCDYKYSVATSAWFKYHIVPMTWSDARLRCALEGATLASPTTREIRSEMVQILKDSTSKREIFTGIHATLASGDHNTVEGIPLSNIPAVWAENEPDNKNNIESCITFDIHGRLADRTCGDTRPYICYRSDKQPVTINECGVDPAYSLDNRTKKCYKFHAEPRNFSRAAFACTAEGGHLAIINSDVEATVLTEILARHPQNSLLYAHVEQVDGWKETALVGFYDWGEHGEWRTIHGQTLAEAGYERWHVGEPNAYPGEFCGSLWRNGLLIDVVCNKNFAFICEKSPLSPAICSADQLSLVGHSQCG